MMPGAARPEPSANLGLSMPPAMSLGAALRLQEQTVACGMSSSSFVARAQQ